MSSVALNSPPPVVVAERAPAAQAQSASPKSDKVQTTAEKVVGVILLILGGIPGVSTVVYWPLCAIYTVAALRSKNAKTRTELGHNAVGSFVLGIPVLGNALALYALFEGSQSKSKKE